MAEESSRPASPSPSLASDSEESDKLNVRCSCISGDTICIANDDFFRIYIVKNYNEIEMIHEAHVENVSLLEVVPRTQTIFYVGGTNDRTLTIGHYQPDCDIKKEIVHVFSMNIVQIKANNTFLVVALPDRMAIFNYVLKKKIHEIQTEGNPNGIIGISLNIKSNPYFTYALSRENGMIGVYNLIKRVSLDSLMPHKHPIKAIAMSNEKPLMATASVKGTVIRVHSLVGDMMYELRRGCSREAEIFSLTFSPSGLFLSCASNTETLHVFKLDGEEEVLEAAEVVPSGWFDFIGNAVTYVRENYMDGKRCFAYTYLNKKADDKTISSFYIKNENLYVIVISQQGNIEVFQMDTEIGGLFKLVADSSDMIFTISAPRIASRQELETSLTSEGSSCSEEQEVMCDNEEPEEKSNNEESEEMSNEEPEEMSNEEPEEMSNEEPEEMSNEEPEEMSNEEPEEMSNEEPEEMSNEEHEEMSNEEPEEMSNEEPEEMIDNGEHEEDSCDIEEHEEDSCDIEEHEEDSCDIEEHEEDSCDIEEHEEDSCDNEEHEEDSCDNEEHEEDSCGNEEEEDSCGNEEEEELMSNNE